MSILNSSPNAYVITLSPNKPRCVGFYQEYKRLETLRQIKEADRRTEEMTQKKEEMIAQRRRAAVEVHTTVQYYSAGRPDRT